MKKFVLFNEKIILTILALFLAFNLTPTKVAFAQTSYYAKVEGSGVYLYSFPNEANVLFEIPLSYFVLVESSSGNFFQVSYNGVSGYVKKKDVSLMNGTPKNAYYKQNFSVVFANLYEEASSSSAVLTDKLNRNVSLEYYGIKSGEYLTEDNCTWYYVKANVEGKTLSGYVFSQFIYNNPLKNFEPNTERFNIVTEEMLIASTTNQFQALSTGTKILLVFAIAIPSVLILYFLIKPSKIMQLSKAKQKSIKHKQKKIRHGDYFEFDENEL